MSQRNQNFPQPLYDSDNIDNDDNSRPNNSGSTQSTKLNPLDLGSDSACARANLKEFDQIRKRLAKVSLPNE